MKLQQTEFPQKKFLKLIFSRNSPLEIPIKAKHMLSGGERDEDDDDDDEEEEEDEEDEETESEGVIKREGGFIPRAQL